MNNTIQTEPGRISTITKTMDRLRDNDIVFNCGHRFIVSNVRVFRAEDGVLIVRYTGRCDGDSCNDSIRGTVYDGGTYGGNADLTVTISTVPHGKEAF